MRRTDLTLTAALCASLLLHGLVIDALIERETHAIAASIWQPPFNLAALLKAHAGAAPVILLLPPPPAPQPKLKPPPKPQDLFGERNGRGTGQNSSEGDEPMQAPLAEEDQATLTPRPGHPSDGGSGGASPKRANPLVQQPTQVAMVPFGLPHQQPLTDPLGSPQAPPPPLLPPRPFHQQPEHSRDQNQSSAELSPTTRSVATAKDSSTTAPVKIRPTTKPIELAKKPQPTTAPIVNAAATQPVATTQLAIAPPMKLQPGKLPPATQAHLDHPAPPQPAAQVAITNSSSSTPSLAAADQGHGKAGDPGHRSESESDPFSDHPVFTYRDGKVEAKDGRKVKTVKPKLTEAGWTALRSMDSPVIIIWVKIDENGKVIDADYIRRSNIPEVDLPHLEAAWQWEFEPTRDKNGHPRPDTLIIPFVWR